MVHIKACDPNTCSGVVHLHVFAGAGVLNAKMITINNPGTIHGHRGGVCVSTHHEDRRPNSRVLCRYTAASSRTCGLAVCQSRRWPSWKWHSRHSGIRFSTSSSRSGSMWNGTIWCASSSRVVSQPEQDRPRRNEIRNVDQRLLRGAPPQIMDQRNELSILAPCKPSINYSLD